MITVYLSGFRIILQKNENSLFLKIAVENLVQYVYCIILLVLCIIYSI